MSRCGSALFGGLQVRRQIFPFPNLRRVAGLLLIELRGLTLALIGAHKALHRGFEARDCVFRATNLFFEFMDSIFQLLPLDRVQALLRSFCRRNFCRVIAILRDVGRDFRGRDLWSPDAGNISKSGCHTLTALLAPQVVLVIPREDLDFSFAHFEDACRQIVDEVAVMRHENDGTRVFHQRIEQDILSTHVEVIRRFVEKQEVCRMQQQSQQGIPPALAAGEHANLLEDIIL